MPVPERATQVVLVVSVMLAIGAPLAWSAWTPTASAGTPPETTAAQAKDRPPVDRSARRASVPQIATRSARIGDIQQSSSATPRQLQLPSLGVTASVGAIGIGRSGEMEVPEDVRDVGWYRFGPAPGEPGATVIAGHVDSRTQGAGAFFDLRRLEVGARVKVVDHRGDVQRYDVVARRSYDKQVLPTAQLFTREGPPQLVLITCGGSFDRAAGSYQNNVVIYAEPV